MGWGWYVARSAARTPGQVWRAGGRFTRGVARTGRAMNTAAGRRPAGRYPAARPTMPPPLPQPTAHVPDCAGCAYDLLTPEDRAALPGWHPAHEFVPHPEMPPRPTRIHPIFWVYGVVAALGGPPLAWALLWHAPAVLVTVAVVGAGVAAGLAESARRGHPDHPDHGRLDCPWCWPAYRATVRRWRAYDRAVLAERYAAAAQQQRAQQAWHEEARRRTAQHHAAAEARYRQS